jgi:hypothetical protein
VRTSIIGCTLFALATAAPATAQIGGEITDPAPIANALSNSSDQYPEVATDGRGNWVSVWQSTASLANDIYGDDRDIFVARSSDNGANWTRGVLNHFADSDNTWNEKDEHPQIATDRAGNWIAVWQSRYDLGGSLGEDYDILIARSTNNGASWTQSVPLNSDASTDVEYDARPQIATDTAGNWIAVWNSSNGGTDSDVMFARSTDNGLSWSPAAPLQSNAWTDDASDAYPEVATDGAGRWVVVWELGTDPNGPFGPDGDILFARSVDNGVSWSDPAPLNSDATTDGRGDHHPHVATDGAGNWVAVWQAIDGHTSSGDDWDIRVARSSNDGATWTASEILNINSATDTDSDHNPQLAVSGRGLWIVVWYAGTIPNDGSPQPDHDILMALSKDRGVSWTWPQPLNTNAATDEYSDWFPQIVTSNTGHWMSVWHVIRHNADVFFAHWAYCDLTLVGTEPTMIHFAPPYAVIAGSLSDLHSQGGFGSSSCLESFAESPGEDPNEQPPAGDGWYYLARGEAHCTSFGDSGLVPDPRDDLDQGDPCP